MMEVAAEQPRAPGVPYYDRFLVSIDDAAMMIGRSITFVYACIGDGTLKAVKSNARTLVVVDSLRAYAAALPSAQTKKVPERPPARMRPPPARLRKKSA
jgi:hypothetical protein